MKALKITEKNKVAIEAELSECNGKATAHAYTKYEDIAQCANIAEGKVIGLVGSQDRAIGAVFCAQSGSSVPNAYKYTRESTSIRIERRASGWFLTDVFRKALYKDGGKKWLVLTEQQDLAAVALLRKSYALR